MKPASPIYHVDWVLYVTKNQWRARFSKTEKEVMNDGLCDEDSCVGKTLTGTFLISAVEKMVMGLERVVDDFKCC